MEQDSRYAQDSNVVTDLRVTTNYFLNPISKLQPPKPMKTAPHRTSQLSPMKICLPLLCGASLIALPGRAQVLFSENFDGMTPAVNPVGFTVNLPAAPTPGTLETTVVPFGGGNGLRLLDQSSTGNAQVQQDFTTSSSVHLSLSFIRNQNIAPASTTAGLFISLGFQGANQPSLASRTMAIKIFNDGTFGLERGIQGPGGVFSSSITSGSATYETPAAGPFSTHTLDIFAYAGTTGGSGWSYTGPDAVTRTLAAKSYSVFIDNVLITSFSDSLSLGNYGFTSPVATPYVDPGDMGRFGIVTGGATARVGMDFTVDNIMVSVIPVPEPSSLALVALALTCIGRRLGGRKFISGI
jgi:hypothetical protein